MTNVNMTSMGSPALLKRRLAKNRRPLDGVDNYLSLPHLTYIILVTLFQSAPTNGETLLHDMDFIPPRFRQNVTFAEEAQNSKMPNSN